MTEVFPTTPPLTLVRAACGHLKIIHGQCGSRRIEKCDDCEAEADKRRAFEDVVLRATKMAKGIV